MNIYDIPGETGNMLCDVQHKLILAVCKLEEIPPEHWSNHMDDLHKELRRLIRHFEFVQTIEEQEEELEEEEDPCICIPDEPNTNCPSCF